MTYLETARDMFKGIHHASGLATVENRIVNVKVMCEGWNKENRKEDLNQRQEIYELAVKSYGKDTPTTIGSGVNLTFSLWNAHHGIEAERLLIKLAAKSKQVHGPDPQPPNKFCHTSNNSENEE